jgi:uridylate kinase
VNGLYDADPVDNPDAKLFDDITYMEVIEKQLRVMDMTAISLAMDNHLPLVVFNLKQKGNIKRVGCGEAIGTYIHN